MITTQQVKKLEDQSLDAIFEVIGAPRPYNQGKSAMRDWFLRRLQASAAITFCVRHLKRGSTYEVLGDAKAQISTDLDGNEIGLGLVRQRSLVEGAKLTVYRDPVTADLYVRFPDEFSDGRFEVLTEAEEQGASSCHTRPGPDRALADVLAARIDQVAKGYGAEHDDDHSNMEIITGDKWGTVARLLSATQKPPGEYRRDLVKSAAMIVAEIERLDRKAAKEAA